MTRQALRQTGWLGVVCAIFATTWACAPAANPTNQEKQPVSGTKSEPQTVDSQTQTAASTKASDAGLETVTFGAGCFWCVEAVFQQLRGVETVESGYSGGAVENPTYDAVCTGTTGHAEVCQIRFRPEVISFEDLLEVFWKTHDPTTLNQQGNDVGTQYRSAIFYHNDQQRALAEEYKEKLNESGVFSSPIVTEITPYKNFYKAEGYHQNYFRENPNQGYCRVVIVPKVEKFKKVFAGKLKQN